MDSLKVHKRFKLEGISFASPTEILEFCKKERPQLYNFLCEWFDNSDFLKIRTSGSTGVPKEIELRKSHMINSANATGTYLELPAGTKALLCLSPDYIAGKMMFIRALTLGWELDVVAPDSRPLQDSNKSYDFTAMVPLQVNQSIAELNRVKKLIIGGAPLDNTLRKKLEQLSTLVYETFGMTETITHIALKKLRTKATAHDELSYAFELLPGVNIHNKKGTLEIDAPAIADDIIVTNDIISLKSARSFVWLGRTDSVINTGGVKVFPEQIEQKIQDLISNRFFVFSQPDKKLGSKLVLILEQNKISVQEKHSLLLKIQAKSTISKYEYPKEIYALTSFIETPTNKINRAATYTKLCLDKPNKAF